MEYDVFLKRKLEYAKQDLSSNLEIEVISEQAFVNLKTLKPNTIYVLIKYLTANVSFEGKTQPMQLMILSEQNSIEETQMLFNYFVEQNNLKIVKEGTTIMKQVYSLPVVLSNYNEVAYGYRSILYISATLSMLESVIDVEDVYIDNVKVNSSNFNIAYNMQVNTQQDSGEKLASSVKNISSINFTISIPLLNQYQDITKKIFKIMNVSSTYSSFTGNEDFNLKYTIQNIDFDYNVKLISCQITTSAESIPTMNLGFVR